MGLRWFAGVMMLMAAAPTVDPAQEDLRVFPAQVDGVAPAALVEAHLKKLASEAFERRTAAYEALKTPEQLHAYQQRMRGFFLERIGGLPERTPLNARVVGKESRDGYRIEKVLYQSLPGFHVTAILYLPLTPPPYPGVLLPCGHSENGKAAEAYQRACILLAKNGLAVLCFDPVGQGERKQLLDGQGKGKLRPTAEHNVEAPAAILLGSNLARTMIWDGMRGIDYLCSRADIDLKRIGCAGNSGGGTQTSYLMALDDRIVCAAPNCYLTSFSRLLATIGPQDAEQNIFGQVAFGMDHADYVMMRAPKPTLIACATRDYFDIGGTWDTFREAKRFYARLGFPERVELVETDATHGFSLQLREATVRWMRRWLLGKDDVVTEAEFPVMADVELQCTPRGQVLLLEGARSIFDLYREWERAWVAERRRIWTDRERAFKQVSSLAGIRPLEALPELKAERIASSERNGIHVERIVLSSADQPPRAPGLGTPLTALWFHPKAPREEPVLYLRGDEAETAPGGAVEQLAAAGHPVLAVDLSGLAEPRREPTGARAATAGRGVSARTVALTYLLGKSMIGLWAEETLASARLLLRQPPAQLRRERVRLIAMGETGPAALHAIALQPELFSMGRLNWPFGSWAGLVASPEVPDPRAILVHGALKVYDLPDLEDTLPRGKVVFTVR